MLKVIKDEQTGQYAVWLFKGEWIQVSGLYNESSARGLAKVMARVMLIK